MGGHHRLIHQFMDKKTLAEYLTLKAQTLAQTDTLNRFACQAINFNPKSEEETDQPSVTNPESIAGHNLFHANAEQSQSEDKEREEGMPIIIDIISKFEEERLQEKDDQLSGTNLETSAQLNVALTNAEQCPRNGQEIENASVDRGMEEMQFSPTKIEDFSTFEWEDSEPRHDMHTKPSHEHNESLTSRHHSKPSETIFMTENSETNNNLRKARLSKPCPLSVKNALLSKPETRNVKSSRVKNQRPPKPSSKLSGRRPKVVVKAPVLTKPIQDKPLRVVKRTETKKESQKCKCPECAYSSDYVSSIYTHSASIHYFAQLRNLQKESFMMTSSKECAQCPGRSLENPQMYAVHVGGKHKLIHKFISEDKKILYDQLPVKKINYGYNQNKLQKALKCLVCKGQKPFRNITEYKQHLAVVHFKDQIRAELKRKFPDHLRNLSCFVCQTGKAFKHEIALVNHLVSYVVFT